jgi:hypothetical protein
LRMPSEIGWMKSGWWNKYFQPSVHVDQEYFGKKSKSLVQSEQCFLMQCAFQCKIPFISKQISGSTQYFCNFYL